MERRVRAGIGAWDALCVRKWVRGALRACGGGCVERCVRAGIGPWSAVFVRA